MLLDQFWAKKKKDVMQVVKNCFKMNYDKLFMLHLNVMFYNNAVLCVDKITKNYVFKIRKQNILINGTKFNALTKLVILNNLMWKLWIERKTKATLNIVYTTYLFYSYQDTITQNINVRFYCQFNSETNLCILFKVLNDLHFKRF